MDGMLGDMFVIEEEMLSGEAGQIMSSWEQLPRNCADKLPLPELARKQGYPIGLKNQGATCYLNSLLQVLYYTPEFRQCILRLPLCLDSADKPSQFVSQAKQSFLLGFQRLFSEMSMCDQKAVGTDYLNKAFKWEGQQHTEQQDIQQAMRVIFDTITRALYGTQYHQIMRSLFRGITNRYKTCTSCGQTSDRPEQFFDLMLQVKNISSVHESLQILTTAESMDGDNAIFCETCQCKQDMWLGTRLQELPSTLVLTLNRFDFDYETFQRVKLNSSFEFQLQFDLSGYLMPHPEPDHHIYELYGVVIHRGSAHGGHYLCYVRDLMHQTDWQKGLIQTSQQEAKIQAGREGKEKEQEKQKQKQKQQLKLKEPNNKKLLENWYEINDNISTAIDANKITSQFEGSQSAYILFYRRKSLPVKTTAVEIPTYFADPIKEANKVMQKEREAYEQEKQQIILTIEDQQHKLKTNMLISDFLQAFVEEGSALVMQSEHNGLPYYPMQVANHPDVQYKQDDTISSLGMPHETRWKKYNITSSQYLDIKDSIGKDRLPMELLLLNEGEQPKRILTHSDENFLMLRMKIEKLENVSYENQIITLVSPYKQTVLTDTLNNDDLLLPKLGIFHTTQLHLKSRANQQEQVGQVKEGKKQNINLICFVIERDDVIGLKRFYYEKQKTLRDLFKYFLNMEGIKDHQKHRFRNLNGNRLFYTQHYQKTLEQLDLNQELVRLRLERGQIPIKGDMLIKVKNQSCLFKKEGEEDVPQIERIFDPNTPIKEVKEWACQSYQLQAHMHKLYLTDWVKQPIRSLNRQHLTLFEANFGREETVCLRDIHSPIGEELVHLEVFSTTTGCPDTATKEGIHIKIEQFKTVNDLKELMIDHLQLGEIGPDRLRLREIKRDYMFGSIWRDNNKSVKAVTINSTKVVYQILEQPEKLTDNQIVVVLKKRNKEKRIYEGITQLIFEAGKTPAIEQFAQAVKTRLDCKQDLTLTKYVHHEFEWIELSRKNIELLAKRKKGKQGKQQNKQKGGQPKKGENKKKEEQGRAKKDNQEEINNKVEVSQSNVQEQTQASVKQTEQKNNEKPEKQQKEGKKPQVGQKQTKNDKKSGKGGKGGQNQNQKDLSEQCQNLRKAPVLLKDGDMIGWGLSSDLQGDDLQTDEDAALRITLKKQPGKVKGGVEKGFVIGVDF